MEFWMKNDTSGEAFQFPILPEEYQLDSEINTDVYNVQNIGEISSTGRRKLKTIPLTGFFPCQRYGFCVCEPKEDPYEYVNILNKWHEDADAVRLIITETPVNRLFTIVKFSYGEKPGNRDVYYSMELQEYRQVKEFAPTL